MKCSLLRPGLLLSTCLAFAQQETFESFTRRLSIPDIKGSANKKAYPESHRLYSGKLLRSIFLDKLFNAANLPFGTSHSIQLRERE